MPAESSWPVTAETWPWEVTAVGMSRRQRADIRPHYQASIPAQIARLDVALEPGALAASDDARAEISRFDAELSALLPGSELPLSAVLLRTESASSSQIEQITAGAKALAMASLGLAKFGSNAELVSANVDAMTRAVALGDAVTPANILAVHETLMHGQTHANPGSFRTEQVCIAGSSVSPHGAAFVPPHHSRVVTAVNDLCQFAERTDIPLLAQTAIAHAQFETIHPFNDGNGRTGRALVHAMLQGGGATTRTTVPISAGLLADTGTYFEALTAYRAGDLTPIVESFTSATFAAIANGRRLASDLVAAHARWSQALTTRRTAAVWQVLPLLISQPAVTSTLIQRSTALSQPAADNVIRQLREAGILTKATGGRRYVVWVAEDVTSALDEFAERALRRR